MKKLESLALKFDVDQRQLLLLDQTLLPAEEKWILIESTDQMIECIKALRVRGAPLIGISASLWLAVCGFKTKNTEELLKISDQLYHARPTAVNLMNNLKTMNEVIHQNFTPENLLQKAIELFNEDINLCNKIAENGAALIKDGEQILTHCNTGGLATAGVGTALGVIHKAFRQGKKIHVYVDETRPLLQGGRLTAWELTKLGIPCTLITDNMAAHLMKENKITCAIVGSDRIAKNGDFANKIGTYSVAVNCHYHKIPFYVAAPFTTVDPKCPNGNAIPIEERTPAEVKGVTGSFGTITWAPKEVNVFNPAFDVTPAELTTAWILDSAVYKKEDIQKGCFS